MKKSTKKALAKLDNPYYRLAAQEQAAVDMKIDGYPMTVIAAWLKTTYGTCRQLFMDGGRLHEPWAYRELEIKEAYAETDKKVKDILKKASLEAALTLRRTARKGNTMESVIAAKDILDRTGHKPEDKVISASDPENPVEPVKIYLPDNGRNKGLNAKSK